MSALRQESMDLQTDLEPHFRALGVESVVGYKLWCHRNGFSKDLDKTAAQFQAELDFAEQQHAERDADVAPGHNPQQAEFMSRIFDGEFQNDTLSDVLFRVRSMYNNLDGDQEAREALRRLVLHADKYTNLMRPIQASRDYGPTVTNTYIGALEQLARNHVDWIRPLEDWRPDSPKPNEQFYSLPRHLLAKYDVPRFFDLAFFRGTTPEAQREQRWFTHVGMGQNVRTAGVPMRCCSAGLGPHPASFHDATPG